MTWAKGEDARTAVIRCANCGVANEPDATFCQSCHHFLAWEEADERRPRPAAPVPGPPTEEPEPTPVPDTQPEPEPETASVSQPAPAAVFQPVPAAVAEPAPTAVPEIVPETAHAPDPVQDMLDTVAIGQRLAVENGREDLAQHLELARNNVAEQVISVVVVGEFKRGKSTLVNAILQTAVCPVDADIVTAVPTVIMYGETPRATAHVEAETEDEDTAPVTEDVPLDHIGSYVSEDGNPGNRRHLSLVEVAIPRPILRSGLCLIDTPGVGGLDSAHGVITLSALKQADGVLFVTDASQELTAAEIEFLQTAVERCPNAACVMTKADLYMEWRRIAELDEQHLRDAGIDVPVLPVSSFLRLAGSDPELLVESGYPALVDFLLGTVVANARAHKVASAEREVDFVATQLEERLRAEQAVLEEPARAEEVVERLDEASRESRKLGSPTATWQQMLTDGMQDLVAHVEFDLQERFRSVMRDAEEIIDEGDPKQTWPDIDVWLRRQVVAAAVANYDRIEAEARELADSVAAAFDLAASKVTSAAAVNVNDSLSNVRMASAASLENPAGRVTSMLLAGRTATLVPMILIGTLGHLLMPVVAPIALVLAAGIGQKVIRDERRRQIAYRRQQAKNAARKYVDEIAFMVSKDSREALRVTQRALRDDFQSRATTLQRSSEATLHAVRSAIALSPDEKATRADELARGTAEVVDLRARRRPDRDSMAVVNG
jgi:GTPase SAR1 family protein